MRLCRDILVGTKLKIITDSHLGSPRGCQQTVIISFPSAHPVTALVESHSRHHDEFDVADICFVGALRLLNVKRAQRQRLLVVGKDVKVHTIDAW